MKVRSRKCSIDGLSNHVNNHVNMEFAKSNVLVELNVELEKVQGLYG